MEVSSSMGQNSRHMEGISIRSRLVDDWLKILVTGLIAILASSGWWQFLKARDTKRTQTDHLLLGLAYDKIISLGMSYIERGWITKDEYEDYRRFLYEPYKKLGGNGVTERVMAEVTSLPLRSRARYVEVLNDAKSKQPEKVLPNGEEELLY